MARIESYTNDAEVTGRDKVLGSDVGGATRNYEIEDIGQYFSRANTIMVAGQLNIQFQPNSAVATDAQFYINDGNDGNATQLSNISTFTIHKNDISGTSVENMLDTIVASKFLLVEHGNQSIKGTYTVTSSYDNADDSNFLDVLVTAADATGVVTTDKYYAIKSVEVAGGDKKYTHTQSSALSTWTINHNLGKNPAVSVVDSLNNLVICEVEYTSDNQVVLSFDNPHSGKAYFN